MAATLINPTRTIVDDTLPISCIIENSQQEGDHFNYSIRVTRICNDPVSSWIIIKRFRDFHELSTTLRDYGYEFQLPAKKIIGNKSPQFIAERQKGLQTFLEELLKEVELSNSLLVRRFLDPDRFMVNESDIALQHISMFIRSTNNVYQIIEHLPDFGWRYNKVYYLASKVNAPREERYLVVWCKYGLDKALSDKDILNQLKSIKALSHPCLVPIDDIYANEVGTITVIRYYNKGSLKDYIRQTLPKTSSYWKRYSRRGVVRSTNSSLTKLYAQKILETLNLIYSSGIHYGHLHSGNILFDEGQSGFVKFLDLPNTVIGVSSKYRGYTSSLRKIRNFEQADVYAFGRVLFELATGNECSSSICSDIRIPSDPNLQRMIQSILSPTGEELPTIKELLNDSYFQEGASTKNDSNLLKVTIKTKEAYEMIARTAQVRYESDQAKLKNAERRAKQLTASISDADKNKRRREQLKNMGQTLDETNPNSKILQRSISVDPLQLSAEKQSSKLNTVTNSDRNISNVTNTLSSSTNLKNNIDQSSSVSLNKTSSTSTNVTLPKSTPPPPPPPSLTTTTGISSPPSTSDGNDRGQLLNSITGFSLSALKKTKTNDRSTPKFK